MASVLIVDDNDGVREALRFLLEDAGHQVVEASDGAAGLHLLRTSTEPLVVLTDYRMPHMDGGDLLRAAATEGHTSRHIFVLLLATPSLVKEHSDVHRITTDLGIPIVAKPFDIDELLAVVASRVAALPAAVPSPNVKSSRGTSIAPT